MPGSRDRKPLGLEGFLSGALLKCYFVRTGWACGWWGLYEESREMLDG